MPKREKVIKFILYYQKGTGKFEERSEPKEEYSEQMVTFNHEITETAEYELWVPGDYDYAVKIAARVRYRNHWGKVTRHNFKEARAGKEKRKLLEEAIEKYNRNTRAYLYGS